MFKINLKSNQLLIGLAVLILINVALAVTLFSGGSNSSNDFKELRAIENKDATFAEVSKFFMDLAKEKGARYSFQALKVAKLNQNIDLHLLGHAIGDVLYKQEGVNGITICDNDFRNACSHSVVIGLFNDKGEAALKEVSDVCRKAPGGTGAYTMCFHGLGHGILAYEGYDMEKASAICQKTGTPQYGYSEATQCISGTVMEIIGGGFHDRQIWEAQRVKYLNKENPLALCENDFIPKDSKFLCYDYLTPFLFESVGANVGNPTADDFKKAFKLCDLLPKSDTSNRDACFGGFGKEFDGLVQGRDIRQGSINNLTEGQLKQIYDWCLLAPHKEGVKSCVVHALGSLYWGGENDRKVSIQFCSQIPDSSYKQSCFTSLIGAVSYYMKDSSYRKSFCEELPLDYQSNCNEVLKTNDQTKAQ